MLVLGSWAQAPCWQLLQGPSSPGVWAAASSRHAHRAALRAWTNLCMGSLPARDPTESLQSWESSPKARCVSGYLRAAAGTTALARAVLEIPGPQGAHRRALRR